jgi:ABC-type lipoprotein release transport system permease subunit
MTRGQLALLGGARGALIGLVASMLAVTGAVLASPLMPVGPLRKIEPARGYDVDTTVFAAGVVVLLALCTGAGIAAVLLRGRPARNLASVRAGDQLARAGAPVPVVSGVRFALDRGKDGTVPVRSTLVGVAVALTALVATIVFASGLNRFTSSPTRYGWPWAAQLNDPELDHKVIDEALQKLPAQPAVAGVTEGAYSQFDIDGRSIAAVGIAPNANVSSLPMLRGRAPVRDDEIVFGAKTLDALGLHVGGLVGVRAQQTERRTFRIVGVAVFPRFAPYPGSEPTGLGIGAATTLHAIPPEARLGSGFVLVEGRADAKNIGAMLRREIMHDDPIGSTEVYDVPQRPNDVLSYDRLAETPLVLVALLGVLAIGSTIHLLVTGVRSRRRDVALLKTIGLSRRQALSAVLVQASALILLALAFAVPLGALSGRWLWVETARWLGIADDLPLPLLPIAAITLLALAGAATLATGPGVLAARVQIATALRSE